MFEQIADTIVGSTYLTLTTLFIAFNMMLNWILISDEELLKIEAYRIMVHIGVQNIIQLSSHFLAGLFTLCQSVFDPWVNKIAGGILNAAWIAMLGLILALALNQFSIIYSGMNTKQCNFLLICSSASVIHKAVAYGVGMMFLAVFLTPWCNVEYLLEWFCYTYTNLPFNDYVSNVDWFYTISVTSLSFIIYLFAFILILKKRRSHRMVFNKKQLRILLHSVIIYCWVLFITFTFHDYKLFLPLSQWTFFGISISWMLYCGLSPMLYIAFNRQIILWHSTIRKKFVDKYIRQWKGKLWHTPGMIITNLSDKRESVAITPVAAAAATRY